MNIERRYLPLAPAGVETRADGRSVLTGYAAVFYRGGDAGTEFRLWDDIYERILPTAFDRALQEDDVRALFNHDPSEILGRTKAGTLRLSVDDKGLRYEVDPPDWAAGRVESMRRGDVTGSSFSFAPDKTTIRIEKRDNKSVTVLERESVRLFDVGPVTFPAYTGTTAAVRSLDDAEGARREVEEWQRRQVPAGPRGPDLARARCVEFELRAMAAGWVPAR
jgi:HK97 family phage prohead protease